MSEPEKKRVFRIFAAWSDRKEEAWLRAMAARGWHLERAAGIFYSFRRGAASDAVYRLDFPPGGSFDRREYLGLFRDAGWEPVCRFGGWYYFRRPAGDESLPDIYSDPSSRIAKYRRVLLVLTIAFVILVNGAVGLLNRTRSGTVWDVMRFIQAAFALLTGYGMVRLLLLISRLKKTSLSLPPD